MPKAGTSTAEMAGPTANPATSAASNRPTLLPRFAGSALMTMRRTAGTAMPMPTPLTNRASSSTSNVSPAAMATRPTTFSSRPATTNWRA